jgi:threonine dehydrogenase-like Zn-dependent dehydrogenase
VLLPAENVIHVPHNLPFKATASVELAMCVGASILMLKDMNVLQGKRVAINGLGPAGLIAAQMARAEGASEVVGFDLNPNRCRYALEHAGLTEAITPEQAVADACPVRPSRPKVDTGIDCVGAKRSVEWLMDRTLDTVALFGVQREEYIFAPRHYHPALRLCGYPGHSRQAAEYAVGLMGSGGLDLGILITHEMPLAEYNSGIDLLEQQKAIKICFTPWATPTT